MILRVVIFLGLNFTALGLGGYLMGEGPSSDWYQKLNQAPWIPPGWVFGAAWTLIMVLYAIFMALAWDKVENKSLLLGLYLFQWILNVGWNPVFFYYHQVLAGLIVICMLTLLVLYFQIKYFPLLRLSSLLITPYVIWLLIATSLNAYIYFNN